MVESFNGGVSPGLLLSWVALRGGAQQPTDLGGLHPLGAVFEVVLDRLVFLQGLEAVALDDGVMDEDVLPVVRCDEAEPLLVVEPLHLARGHGKPLLSDVRGLNGAGRMIRPAASFRRTAAQPLNPGRALPER